MGRWSTEAKATQVALEVGRSQEALLVSRVSETGEAWESQHMCEAVEGSIMVVWALSPRSMVQLCSLLCELGQFTSLLPRRATS